MFCPHPTTPSYWNEGSVRLLDGSSRNEGRLEVYWNGQWGTVCDDSWDIKDANVVCRQLGYPSGAAALEGSHFGRGTGDILLDEIRCTGYETSLLDCPSNAIYQHDCDHSEDAGVVCAIESFGSDGYPREGSVRLLGSSLRNRGRVELFHSDMWGLVCDDGSWNMNEATVVCRQLGFPGATHSADDLSYFGEGPILLDDITCEGLEHYLTECQHSSWYHHNCELRDFASVVCSVPETYHPRLVNGTTWHEGRVEIWIIDHWEELCSENFYKDEARTICKQLGFSGLDEIYYYEKFGSILDVAFNFTFDCCTDDTHLRNCTLQLRQYDSCNATSIRCLYDDSLPGAAIAGIICAGVIFIAISLASFVSVYRKTTQKSARSSPGVTSSNDAVNQTGPQSVYMNSHAETYEPELYNSGQAPPSYSDAVTHPIVYPNVQTSDSNGSMPFEKGKSQQED